VKLGGAELLKPGGAELVKPVGAEVGAEVPVGAEVGKSVGAEVANCVGAELHVTTASSTSDDGSAIVFEHKPKPNVVRLVVLLLFWLCADCATGLRNNRYSL